LPAIWSAATTRMQSDANTLLSSYSLKLKFSSTFCSVESNSSSDVPSSSQTSNVCLTPEEDLVKEASPIRTRTYGRITSGIGSLSNPGSFGTGKKRIFCNVIFTACFWNRVWVKFDHTNARFGIMPQYWSFCASLPETDSWLCFLLSNNFLNWRKHVIPVRRLDDFSLLIKNHIKFYTLAFEFVRKLQF